MGETKRVVERQHNSSQWWPEVNSCTLTVLRLASADPLFCHEVLTKPCKLQSWQVNLSERQEQEMSVGGEVT